MPIKGLTDLSSLENRGLPVIARLHKGAPKPTEGNRPGQDLEYFRVEFESGYEDFRETWEEMYGPEPQTFRNVFLAAETAQEAFETWMEDWNGSGTLLKRCDGENIVRWWNEAAGMYSTAKVRCANNPDTPCKCKRTGRLMIALPEFMEATGVLGQIMVLTHSINDIIAVSRYLYGLERVVKKLTGIPFVFGREAQELSVPKQAKAQDGSYKATGQRMKTSKSLFYVYAEPDYIKAVALPALNQQAQIAAQQTAATLPLPAVDSNGNLALAPNPAVAAKALGNGDKPRILGREIDTNVIPLPTVTQTETPTLPAETPKPANDETVIEDVQIIPEAPAQPKAQRPTWDTRGALEMIKGWCDAQLMFGMQESEIARLAGVREFGVKGMWTSLYKTPDEAFAAIKANFAQEFPAPSASAQATGK